MSKRHQASPSLKSKTRNDSSADETEVKTVTTTMSQTQIGADVLAKGDPQEYAKMMKKLVNNKEFSDVKFLIGASRKPVFAHRCILSARCAVFKAMFADKSVSTEKDVPLVLSDMSPDIFNAMLEFIYTNCVTLSSKTAIDVLATSLEYGLDDLRNMCVEYLDQNLTSSNACDVIQAAVTYNQNDLKEKAMVFIEDHTVEVFKSKSFQEISEDTLVTILRSSRLDMDELDLLKSVKEWATVNSVISARKAHEVARQAVKHIRLPLLSAEELTSLEEESKKDEFIPVGQFAYAWKLHALKQGEKENILSIRRRGTTARDHHRYLVENGTK